MNCKSAAVDLKGKSVPVVHDQISKETDKMRE